MLPAAVGDYQHTVSGDTAHISHPDNNQALKLRITPLPNRCPGLIRIQHIDVQFSLKNMTQEQRSQSMFHFDRRFQRDGD